MKHNNIIYKYYYQTYMKKNLWLIWIIMLVPFILFPQKQTFIQPLPAQKSISSLNNDNPEVNAEYVKALQKYEALIKEYPGEKKLYYNIDLLICIFTLRRIRIFVCIFIIHHSQVRSNEIL